MVTSTIFVALHILSRLISRATVKANDYILMAALVSITFAELNAAHIQAQLFQVLLRASVGETFLRTLSYHCCQMISGLLTAVASKVVYCGLGRHVGVLTLPSLTNYLTVTSTS